LPAGAGRVGSTIRVVKLTMSAAGQREGNQAQVASHEDVSPSQPGRERFLLLPVTRDLCRRLRGSMSYLPTAIDHGFRDPGGRAPTAMSFWDQPDSGGVWTALASRFDSADRWLYALIHYFSNYAIAY
jgi:hypothetical protein